MARLKKNSPQAKAWAKRMLIARMKKAAIRTAGRITEKKFFGPKGIFAMAGHVKHLEKNPLRKSTPAWFYDAGSRSYILDLKTSTYQIRPAGTGFRYSFVIGSEVQYIRSADEIETAMDEIDRTQGRKFKRPGALYGSTRRNPGKKAHWEPPHPWKNIAENTITKSPYILAGDGNVYGYSGSSYGGPWSNQGTLEEFTAKVNGGRYRIAWLKNPGAAWHEGLANAAEEYGRRSPEKLEKVLAKGMEVAHRDSARAARRLKMNTAREHHVSQLAARKTRSNPLAVFGLANPPKRISTGIAGVVYGRCIEIRAEKLKFEPGYYKHPFSRKAGVQILALDNGDLLVHSTRGVNLWEPV